MKNILSLILLISILISGCSQEELLKNESTNFPKITAGFEQDESRTYIEEGNLLRWTENDQISFFYKSTLNLQYQFDGETGDNAGTFSLVNQVVGTGNDLNRNYAVYPYASKIKITENGVITTTLPAEQSYAENSFGLGDNTMVAVTQNTNDTFLKFKNIGGYLKLQLYGDDIIVKTIILKGNDNEKIAGKATITPVFSGEPSVSMAANATETITLDCGEGVKIGTTAKTATAFWMVIPPTTFEGGFTVTVIDADGNEFSKSTSNKIDIERNVINPMAAFEVEMIPNNEIWYTSWDGNIINPDALPGAFGANILTNTYENGRGVITFDGDVTSIGARSFFQMMNLKSVTIPNSVTKIEWQAFYYTGISSFAIPNSVTEIENGALARCRDLSSIYGKFAADKNRCVIIDGVLKAVAPAGLTETEYQIPNNVTTIASETFAGYGNFYIPNSVKHIEERAIYFCGESEFKGDSELISEDRHCLISDGTLVSFRGPGVTEYSIPNGVTRIGELAFTNVDHSLKTITIPNGVKEIGTQSFYECDALQYIMIPSSVELIEGSAFTYCDNLCEIYCAAVMPPVTYGNGMFSSCCSPAKIYVPIGSGDAYKTADYWKDYAEIIEEKEM